MCRNEENEECIDNYVPKCPSFVADKPDKSKYYTYCDRTPLKLRIVGMEKACRFGYCVCFLDAEVEYCYLCDDFKEGLDDTQS
jgi:hypothetical protein